MVRFCTETYEPQLFRFSDRRSSEARDGTEPRDARKRRENHRRTIVAILHVFSRPATISLSSCTRTRSGRGRHEQATASRSAFGQCSLTELSRFIALTAGSSSVVRSVNASLSGAVKSHRSWFLFGCGRIEFATGGSRGETTFSDDCPAGGKSQFFLSGRGPIAGGWIEHQTRLDISLGRPSTSIESDRFSSIT
jgi:hypothetical protein